MKILKTLAPLAVGALLTAVPSFATAVTGDASIAGTVMVSATAVDFGYGTGAGFVGNVFQPNGTADGDFSGLSGGTIHNLSGGAVTGPNSQPQFASFVVTAGTIDFDLTAINAGYGSAGNCASDAVGSTCTLTNSPFTLTQTTADSVAVNLSLEGDAYFPPKSSGSTPYTVGAFTTQFTAAGFNTVTQLVTAIEAGQTITSSYSASFTAAAPSTTTPEPASLLLAGIGLLGAGLVARRKVRS